jgi:hypothetical protein
LHAIWDDLLSTEKEPAAIEKLAVQLMEEYPRAALADELTKINNQELGRRECGDLSEDRLQLSGP